MGIWKKKQTDERVINIQNKIYKEMYLIIMVLSLISVAVKYFTIEFSLRAVMFEWIVILVTSIYYVARSAYLGIYSDEVELHDNNSKMKLSKKNIIYGIALGVILAIIFATNSAVNYADSQQESVLFFISVFFISLFIYAPLFAAVNGITYSIAKRKSEKINQKELEDSEGKW
ncbi:DUF6773 family protein [Fredinandcohnia sp. 179-A 10B2 NHS]|uniref:DUF6773 family protein n=1 Tax=Fredinandcohnia sp. 179-A 10B2 NHS TaxID=3235176 RepID=UPI00399EFA77